MAESNEFKEFQATIKSCSFSSEYQGTKYYEVVAVIDGVEALYVTSKEEMSPGDYKVAVGSSKNTKYKGYIKKAKEGGGSRGPAAPRDYTYEGRMRAVDAVIAHLQGKGDLHTICTAAAAIQEFYKNGTIPPAK